MGAASLYEDETERRGGEAKRQRSCIRVSQATGSVRKRQGPHRLSNEDQEEILHALTAVNTAFARLRANDDVAAPFSRKLGNEITKIIEYFKKSGELRAILSRKEAKLLDGPDKKLMAKLGKSLSTVFSSR